MHFVGYTVHRPVPTVRHIDGNHGRLVGVELSRQSGNRRVERGDVGVFRKFSALDHLCIENNNIGILCPCRSDDPCMCVRDGGNDVHFRSVRRGGCVGIGIVVVSGMKQNDVRSHRGGVLFIFRGNLLGIAAAVPFARIQGAIR